MSPVPHSSPSSLDSHLGFWLRYVSNHVSARFQKLLEAQDISVTEWVALRALFDRDETTHAALIGALGMTKGAASKIVSRLEERGLASRRQAKGDAREQALGLTHKGRALVPRLAALADDNDAHCFDHLAVHEREALMRLLRTYVAHHGLDSVPVS